ncbi:glycoside hydrolase family 19 protein [Pseudoxanthomonas putridarboris]|uniref:Glycoside hydrolase family 19 protein n=1 Tax=Pseudoxanthomonas putridarboris TaxID=752605 RepID=A0ABU9J5E6_9GAMM
MTRPLLHLEVFSGDDVEAFIRQCRRYADHLPKAQYTLLKLNTGDKLGSDATLPEAVRATVGTVKGAQVVALNSAPLHVGPDGKRWRKVTAQTGESSVTGWVEEAGRLVTPWHWTGFTTLDAPSTRAGTWWSSVAEYYEHRFNRGPRPAESAFYQQLRKAIDTDGDGDLSEKELDAALHNRLLAPVIGRTIARHESEWYKPEQKFGVLDQLAALVGPKAQESVAKEKPRIERLQWWNAVQAKVPGFPSGKVYHFHPVGLAGNFQCNCGCINVNKFLEEYNRRHGEFSNSLGQTFDQASLVHLKTLIQGIVDYYKSKGRECYIPHIAYMLATARHETLWNGIYFEPRTEGGGQSYFNKYDPVLASTQAHRNRAVAMENTDKGDGYKYRGRGYVQLTWKVNYRRCGEHLGIDLVNSPDSALTARYASGCMIHGMYEGIFTGRRITSYLNESTTDYVNARRAINGLDKADLIAGYANLFESILEKSKC